MSAVLKRLITALIRNKKARRAVGGIVLGLLLLLVMPLAAITGLFRTDPDATQFQSSLTAEERTEWQRFKDIAAEIETTMTAAGLAHRTEEAQLLYALALLEFAEEPDFVPTLVSCFAPEQTDAQLIAAVNTTFGTELSAEEFTQIMAAARAVHIDTTGYIDPATKNNLDLVQWAIGAERSGWGYVWGTCGQVLDEALLEAKLEQYPDALGEHEAFIRETWLYRRTADCVGLIKGYGWFDPETQEIRYNTNGMPDVGSDGMYQSAAESGIIDTLPEIPGLAVWREGHIGIYIGGGEVIHASGTLVGVIRSQLSEGDWTHWLKIPYITYLEEGAVASSAVGAGPSGE